MDYNSEGEFLDEVEKCFKENGFKTWREEIPDKCKGWEYPYKADLIVWREDVGYIGVEGKNTNTLRSGGKFAKAIKQINEKYRPNTFFNGILIKKWAVLVPLTTIWEKHNEENSNLLKNEIVLFLRGFLKVSYDISLVEYYPESEWLEKGIVIDGYLQNPIKIGRKNKWRG